MKPEAKPPVLTGLRIKYRHRFDAVMMLLYLALVYVWGLGAHPLGRDYAALASRGADLPFLARQVFAWEVGAFGHHAAGYHLVNLALIYLCMLLIYRLTNYAVRGLWWMGTLAASLFMANPVRTESALNLCGVGDIIPCLAALAAVTFYAAYANENDLWKLVVSIAFFALAVLAYPANAFLFLVILVYELMLTEPDYKGNGRLVPFLVLSVASWVVHWDVLTGQAWRFERMFAPLYLILYPIGILPETARRFVEHPWLGWLAALGVLALFILLYRKARRPAVLFGVLAMFAVQAHPGGRPVDPVHMVGGGQLLLACAFFNVALLGLFCRIMENVRWRVSTIGFTTILAVAFFVMQIRVNIAWSRGGADVRAFQEAAAMTPDKTPAAICPGLRYRIGVPLCLSESARYETPFNKATVVQAFFPMDLHRNADAAVRVDEWTPDRGVITVECETPLHVAPWPYTLSRMGGRVTTESAHIELTGVDETSCTFTVTPLDGQTLPAHLIPGPNVALPESDE